jgi:hypothetical protein
MSLSMAAEAKLRDWLRGNTWSFRRTAEMERWLEVVDQCLLDHRGHFDADGVRRFVYSVIGYRLRRSGVLAAELELRLRLASAMADIRRRARNLARVALQSTA